MPMIDITAALTSPMLADSFSVLRRTETVGANGRSTVTTQTIAGLYGPVKPADANDLKRYPDMDVTEKTITVTTMYALRGESDTAGTEYKPDVVVWNEDNFLVRHVEDFSNFGPGFVRAICTSIDLVDAPPKG